MHAGHPPPRSAKWVFQDLLKRGSHAPASNQTHHKPDSSVFTWQAAILASQAPGSIPSENQQDQPSLNAARAACRHA